MILILILKELFQFNQPTGLFMIISIIVAIGKNNEIGKANNMLWHLPAELKRFKEITTGHAIVMGRNTFNSLPKGPLPNRKNVILTRNSGFSSEGCLIYSSLDQAFVNLLDDEEVFIIGGGDVYQQVLPIADKLYITKVHADFPEADTFFPEIKWKEWKETFRETHPADEKNAYSFTFYEYERL